MVKTLTLLAYLFGGAEPHQVPMTLSSAVIQSSGEVPVTFTCRGRNISIPLRWEHIPSGTRSLALIMYDKESFQKHQYLWAVYNIPPKRHWIDAATKFLQGERYAQNSQGHFCYDGPCPPPGEAHRYVIKLYALKARFYFHQNITTGELLHAMQHRIIATAKIEVYVGHTKQTTS